MKNSLKKIILMALLSGGLAACSSTGYDNTYSFNDDNAIGNKNTTTVPDKTLNQHYTLKILKSGVSGDQYVRISSVSLNDMVVIAAVSSTSVHNQMFVDILKKSKPIADTMYHISPIFKRKGKFKVTNIAVADIPSNTVRSYLFSLGYAKNKHVIERVSVFAYHNETMKLIEYILPSVEDYTNFYLVNVD